MSGSTALRPGPSSTMCSTPGAGRSKRRLGNAAYGSVMAGIPRGSRTGRLTPACQVARRDRRRPAPRDRDPRARRARPSGPRAPSRAACAPPITSRSPEPGARSRDGPPRLGLHEERAARAEREDRDDRVVELAQLTVAVRRDAVAAVAVVVERRPAQRHAVPSLERGAAPRASAGCGARLRAPCEAGEPRVVDHPVVHPAPALLPLDRARRARRAACRRRAASRTRSRPTQRSSSQVRVDGRVGIDARVRRCRAGRSGAAAPPMVPNTCSSPPGRGRGHGSASNELQLAGPPAIPEPGRRPRHRERGIVNDLPHDTVGQDRDPVTAQVHRIELRACSALMPRLPTNAP